MASSFMLRHIKAATSPSSRRALSLLCRRTRGGGQHVAARTTTTRCTSNLVTPITQRLVHYNNAAVLSTTSQSTSKRLHSSLSDGLWSIPELITATILAIGTTVGFATWGSEHFIDNEIEMLALEENAEWKTRISCNQDDKSVYYGPSLYPDVYNASVGALQGHRSSMEDRYCVGDGGRFAAVFDGHGGAGVSEFLQHGLLESYKRHYHDLSETNRSKSEALQKAFHTVGEEVLKQALLNNEGSTAVAVVLDEDDRTGERTLITAHVGDSRAVLCRKGGQVMSLTRDHTPLVERRRLMREGHDLEWDAHGQVYRIHQLAISRSIGDAHAKPAVSDTPEMKEIPISDDNDEFVLLASDGLWDVMTNEEAVQYVHQHYGSNTNKQGLGHALAKEAIRRGSVDNVCVAIVWL